VSPLLFNLYMADLEEIKNRRIKGVAIGKIKIRGLAYADDIVLIMKNKKRMQDMMCTFKRFLVDRKLRLCLNKTKMLVFNKKKERKNREIKFG
jgi:hypothetical protein